MDQFQGYNSDPDDEASVTPSPCFLADLGLVRWLVGRDGVCLSHPPSQIALGESGRVRYVIPHYANPGDRLPSLLDEEKYLADILHGEAISPGAQSVLNTLMDPFGFDLLHFACHGDATVTDIEESGLFLGRFTSGNPDMLTADDIGENAQLKRPDSGPIVFVNACQTGRIGYA